MQTVHKISGGDAEQYATYLTVDSGRGDYYIDGDDSESEGEGEGAEGEWHGSPRALTSLGLSADRPVAHGELVALMNGQAPNDGREIRGAGGNGTKVAGIDIAFSPPKTVSALWAAASEEDRERIERAHKDAVHSALGHIERTVEPVRTREAGQLKWNTAESLVAAKFMHTSARLSTDQRQGEAPDPQLHTHVVILAAEKHDGGFAAVDSRQLFLSARGNGAWYRAVLAHNLQAQGVEIERATGNDGRYFEVQGVSKELAEHWSSRSEQIGKTIRDFKNQYGREPTGKERASISVSTRASKSAAPTGTVDAFWKELAVEYGLTSEHAHNLFGAPERTISQQTPGHERTSDQQPGQARDLARGLIECVTSKSSVVSERDLYASAYELSTGVSHPSEAHRLVGELARSGELIQLRDGVWTTRELREREQRTIATVKERTGQHAAPVSERSVQQAERDIQREIGGPLSAEQREALQTLTGQGGVSVLVGQAGSGKGVVLHAATNAWQKDGYRVIGTAIAGAIAERLGADVKTDQSLNTDALMSAVEKGTVTLGQDMVVVMDEAGMADTNRLSQLVQLAAEKESKLVLAGDSAQLSPIGAGGLFAQISEQAPGAELQEVHRAENQWEREAWAQVREGNATIALASYEAHDRLHIADTREQAAEQMVADWNEQRLQTPEGRTVMLTDSSNEELDKLNKQAQEYRDHAGELGNDRAQLPGAPYALAAGDQVIFTKAHYQPGQDRVENGTLGTIKDIQDKQNLTIDTHGAKEREVNVNTIEFKDLRLGYAQHVYKAQGLTATNALALIGGWQTDRERAYVALTRAREQTNIYTSRENLGNQNLNTKTIERLADRIAETKAQQASITHQQTTHHTITQTPTPGPENTLQPGPEQNETPGIGAFSPHSPDPSPQTKDRETNNGPDTTEPIRDQHAEHDQTTPEHDHPGPDRDQGLGLGTE